MNDVCLIYCRVSTKEQAKGSSIKNQEGMCRKYAKKNGLKVFDVFKDEGKSGTTLKNRDSLEEALSIIADEKIGYFLVTETDRLTRKEVDHFAIKAFLQKSKCKLIAVNQPYTEMDTEEGELVDGIMANINAFFSKIYGKKTRKHLMEKVLKGEWLGAAPLGYINVNIGTKDKPQNIIQIDKYKSLLVFQAFDLFSTGVYTASQILNIMYQKGLKSKNNKKLPKSSFINMLKNPFYYGEMLYKGELYSGKHQPLITKPLFDKCQAVLETHSKGADRTRKHDEKFYLSSYLKCGICGGKVTGEIHKEKGVSYYHCSGTKKKHSNKGQNIDDDDLEKMIAKQFKSIELSKPLMEKIIDRAKDILKETHKGVDVKKKVLNQKIDRAEGSRNSLERKFIDNDIDKDIYDRQHKLLEREIKEYRVQLSELDEDRTENIEIFDKFMALTDDLQKTFLKADPHLKRHLLSLFFEKFTIKDKKITYVKYTKIMHVLLDNEQVIINQNWLQRLEYIARYFAFEKGAYCPNLRLEERMANETDEWVM